MDEKVKGKRGKSKGRPAGGNTTIIEDASIAPYIIYVDANCYTVADKKEGSLEKGFGYFTTLGGALTKIVRMKLVNNKTYTVPEYIKAFEDSIKEFNEKYKI